MESLQQIVKETTARDAQGEKREAAEIVEGEEQIRNMRTKLSSGIKQYQPQIIKTLAKEGVKAWNKLNDADMWQKENLIALFSCPDVMAAQNPAYPNASNTIPKALTEEEWRKSANLAALRKDPDIVLARLTSALTKHDFEKFYLYNRKIKPIVMAALTQYPELLEQNILPSALLDDVDVFLAYCRSDRHKKPFILGAGCRRVYTLSNLMIKFSVRIRGMPNLMLEAAKNLNFNVVLKYFDSQLRSNLWFALGLLKTHKNDNIPPENYLEYFSLSVRDNEILLCELLKMNGRCLKHASRSIKSNAEMVKIACQNDSSAIVFAESLSTLIEYKDKTFILDVLARWPTDQPGEPGLYNKLALSLKKDLDIIAAAHALGNIVFSDLPPGVKVDPAVWTGLIDRDASIWYELPKCFAPNIDFARAIERFVDDKMVESVLHALPLLRDERSTWSKIIASSPDVESLFPIFQDLMPAKFLCDKALMMDACAMDYEVLRVIAPDLLHDREILLAAIIDTGYALVHIPSDMQIRYPELVVCALCSDGDEVDVSMVANELWTNLRVVAAWFGSGGHMHSEFPAYLHDDEAFGMLVANETAYRMENLDFPQEAYPFFRAGTSRKLQLDKSFMMRVVQSHGILYPHIEHILRRDIDVALVAFGGSYGSYNLAAMMEEAIDSDDSEEYYEDLFPFLDTVYKSAKENVQAYDGFTKGFLPGFLPQVGSQCGLSVFEKGEEFATAFRKTIAEYVGVPAGTEMGKLRKVTETLNCLPPPPSVGSSSDWIAQVLP